MRKTNKKSKKAKKSVKNEVTPVKKFTPKNLMKGPGYYAAPLGGPDCDLY